MHARDEAVAGYQCLVGPRAIAVSGHRPRAALKAIGLVGLRLRLRRPFGNGRRAATGASCQRLIDALTGLGYVRAQVSPVTQRLAGLFDGLDYPALVNITEGSLPLRAFQDPSLGSFQRFLGFIGMMFAQGRLRVAQELFSRGIFIARRRWQVRSSGGTPVRSVGASRRVGGSRWHGMRAGRACVLRPGSLLIGCASARNSPGC